MIRVLSIAWTVVAGAVAAQGAHDAGRMLEARVKDNAGGVAIVQVYYLTDQRQWKQFGGVWWGSEIGTPDSIVCDVRLVIRGKVLPCPRSAFSDLGNPERVRLSLGPKGETVEISGGQSADAYKAQLHFSHGWLRSREVRGAEFPTEAFEITTYSYPEGTR